MQTINKAKLAQVLQKKLGFSAILCEDLVSQIFISSIELILRDTKLKIKNFGSFNVSTKNPRPGMNWASGSAIHIPTRKVIKFTASRNLKAMLQRICPTTTFTAISVKAGMMQQPAEQLEFSFDNRPIVNLSFGEEALGKLLLKTAAYSSAVNEDLHTAASTTTLLTAIELQQQSRDNIAQDRAVERIDKLITLLTRAKAELASIVS